MAAHEVGCWHTVVVVRGVLGEDALSRKLHSLCSSSLTITPLAASVQHYWYRHPKVHWKPWKLVSDDVRALGPRNNAEWFYEMASSIPFSRSLSLTHTHVLPWHTSRANTGGHATRSSKFVGFPMLLTFPFDDGSRRRIAASDWRGREGRAWVLPAVSGHQRRRSCHTAATGKTLLGGREDNGSTGVRNHGSAFKQAH
uniref:Uncharacterized protein n=1 Tax=Anopheles aquasalis TaxID=42839 RepID=T1DF41_ANOAQ